jgi:hypothetical protein
VVYTPFLKIEIDEIMKFTFTHVCEPRPTAKEKPYSVVV